MGVVVIGPQDLDTLEKWVRQYFSPIENKKLDAPVFPGKAFGAFWWTGVGVGVVALVLRFASSDWSGVMPLR